MTTGLKEAILDFFPGNPLARARQGSYAGQAGLLCRAAGLAAIGKKKRAAVFPTGGLDFFSWEESRPWRGLGRLQAPMPGRAETVGLDDSFEKKILGRIPTLAGLRCRAGAAGRQECGALRVGRARTHWASHQTRLGEPVLIGRARTHQTRLGEPSNEVGASHQTRLGRASTKQLSQPPRLLQSLLGAVPTVPAWHVYSDIYLVPARRIYLVPARHV